MTPRPKTLLQMAGALLDPPPLARSALVLIDAQLEYRSGALPLEGIEAAIVELRRLLELARSERVPVVHVVHHGRAGAAAFDPNGPGVAILPELTPCADESVVVKSLPNAFARTELHEKVQHTGREALIIAGFATHMCVSATTRAALDHGYRCTVVAGATATRDLPDPLGPDIVPARVVHRATLAALADRFAVIVPDAAALRAPSQRT
jgi:nicotinamidase-related amidase